MFKLSSLLRLPQNFFCLPKMTLPNYLFVNLILDSSTSSEKFTNHLSFSPIILIPSKLSYSWMARPDGNLSPCWSQRNSISSSRLTKKLSTESCNGFFKNTREPFDYLSIRRFQLIYLLWINWVLQRFRIIGLLCWVLCSENGLKSYSSRLSSLS